VGGPLRADDDQEIALAVHKFNEKPKAGVRHLLDKGVILKGDAAAVAKFLRTTKGLSKRRIGDYLGERSDFTAAVLTAYSHCFDFTVTRADPAFRRPRHGRVSARDTDASPPFPVPSARNTRPFLSSSSALPGDSSH
tara:strand:+ start:46 stop:456 length:411 start_codon:yes stop_codon:yes gene_type:complete